MKSSLLLIHGWGADCRVWKWQAALEADFKESLRINLPGYSGSGKWDTPDLAPAVKTILGSMPDEPPDCQTLAIGWSLGAMALIEAAINSPKRFSAIVLAAASPTFVKRDDFPWGQKSSVVRRMIKELGKDTADTMKRFQALNFTDEELATDDAKEFLGTMWRFQSDPLSLENGLLALLNSDLRAKLDKIETPTLVVHGSSDAVCSVECGRYLAEKIPDAKLAIIDGAGHAPFVTRAEEFRRVVNEFTESL